MIITKNNLQKWVKIPEQIAELTNQKIIEVEAFSPLVEAKGLIIGKVLTCNPHPDADRLKVTTVDIGDRVEHIVCGANNVEAGQTVIVAPVGSVLPGNFKIKKTKIRGQESNGMICSLEELGIPHDLIPEQYKGGIYYFDEEKTVGSDALEALHLDGWKMTLGLTPNRSDLLSVLGFAYDLAAFTDQKIKLPEHQIKETKTLNPYQVMIETDGCLRYYARYFTNVKIKPSPMWLRNTLMAYEMKSINNVVDISNLVLLEYGTPLHMFDAAKLATNEIIIRNAQADEVVVTLDGIERKLTVDDLLITDQEKPIALAGVMGLENTMITDETTSVVLEAALFEPKAIQQTSKRLNLRSDTSLRFERGVDEERVYQGLEYATKLLIELADAKVSSGVAEHLHRRQLRPSIAVSKTYFNEHLGINMSEAMLKTYFDRYRYQVEETENEYIIQPPSDRLDLKIPADLLEEISRIYGLNEIPMTKHKSTHTGLLTSKQKRLRMLRHRLALSGLNEIISYSLNALDTIHAYENIGEPIQVVAPMSEDKKYLRQSLIPGLLKTAEYNRNRQIKNMHLFEIGHVYAKDQEFNKLALLMSGDWHYQPWQKQAIKTDFYTLKGLFEDTFKMFNVTFVFETCENYPNLHPYRQAHILWQNEVVGFMGQLHPTIQKALNLAETYVLELKLEPFLNEQMSFNYQPVSKYPSIERDLALVVAETVAADDLIKIIKESGRKLLQNVEVFDVYQGNNIEAGKKSIAFHLLFNDVKKTLETETVDEIMEKIIYRLQQTWSAEIRK